MYTEIQIRIKPEQAGVEETLRQIAARVAGVGAERICRVDIVRKSIDARQKEVMFNLVAGLHIDRIEEKEKVFVPAYRDVSDGETVVVVGAGPAGLFAALRLIERGFRPLVLERGKAVEDRKKDLNGLYKTGMVDEDSNFGFGEGGAGTFSDGKLYTRSKKRGDVRRAMEILVYHGANPAILVEAHPHVGTDKLPGVIVNIRKTIQKQGGEIRFGCRVTGLIIRENNCEPSCHISYRPFGPGYLSDVAKAGGTDGAERFCRRIAFRASPAGDRSHPIPHPGRERQMVTCC